MAIKPKPMDQLVLTRFIEAQKDKENAYTELLSHILFQEQKEDALLNIVEALMVVMDQIATNEEHKGALSNIKRHLKGNNPLV